MGSANAGCQHHPDFSTSPQCLCILFLTLQKMSPEYYTSISKKGEGQTGEILAANPDLGRPPGRHQEPFPAVLGRRGTGHRESSWLCKPSQPCICSGGPVPFLHCRSSPSPPPTDLGAGDDLIQGVSEQVTHHQHHHAGC